MTASFALPNVSAADESRASPAGPLTPAHHRAIAEAKLRRKKLNRAMGFATYNTWSFAAIAAMSLLIAVFSPSSLIAVLCLAALAWNEHRGRRQLQQLDEKGPRTLGYNQLAFCALIAVYCIYQLFNAIFGSDPYAEQIAQTPELEQMLDPMRELIQVATIAAYSAVLVLGVGMQGLMAWYYFSRVRMLREYLRETPGWIVELDRAVA